MKILVVTSSYPRFRGDIAGVFVKEWVDELEKLGHQIRVLCWEDADADSAERGQYQNASTQRDFADKNTIRVRYAPTQFQTLFYGAGTPENLRENPWRALLAAPATLAMLAALARQIARERPDILVGHWLIPAGLLVRLVGQLTRIPALIVGHSGGVHLLHNLPGHISAPLASFCARGPMTLPTGVLVEKFESMLPVDGTYATNRRNAHHHEKTASRGLHTMPGTLQMGVYGDFLGPVDGIDLQNDIGEQNDIGLQNGIGSQKKPRRDWLVMGRLVEIKRVELAIEAFLGAQLPDDVRLHIAGDGPLRPSLERLAMNLTPTGAPARVVFHGVVTGEEKVALFKRAAFAIFASQTLPDGRHEGLPVSFLEASAHGVIPVCADIPGIAELLADPRLQLICGASHNAWHHALRRVQGLDRAQYAQLALKQRALVEPFLWSNLIRRWDALLCEVARGEGSINP